MPESRLTRQERQFIKQRANGCCEYCLSQAKFSPDPFSIEHIIPRSKGGTSDLDNLAVACQGCNNLKYNHTEAIDPITGESVPLYHPRKYKWRDNFTWSNDSSQMLGLTPIGRATIRHLQNINYGLPVGAGRSIRDIQISDFSVKFSPLCFAPTKYYKSIQCFLEMSIDRLQLNRDGVVNLRRLLHPIDQHPPNSHCS